MRIIAGTFKGRLLKAPAGSQTRPTTNRVREAWASTLLGLLPDGSADGLTVLDAFAGSGALGLELLSRGAHRVVFVERQRTALAALKANCAALKLGSDTVVIKQLDSLSAQILETLEEPRVPILPQAPTMLEGLRVPALPQAPTMLEGPRVPALPQTPEAPAGPAVSAASEELSRRHPFDVVLLDPPYATPASELRLLIQRLAQANGLANGAIISYEHATATAGLDENSDSEATAELGAFLDAPTGSSVEPFAVTGQLSRLKSKVYGTICLDYYRYEW